MSDVQEYDFAIIGSGFGGSVSALRLTEKGYRVLMLEKGSELNAEDFPETNWNLKRWLWAPIFGWRGLFQMRPFSHVQVLAGAGVGGGSLTYANLEQRSLDLLTYAADPWLVRIERALSNVDGRTIDRGPGVAAPSFATVQRQLLHRF